MRAGADIAPTIDARRATLVMRVGEDFSRRLERGESAEVQLILDGRRSNTAQILLGYSSRIVETYNQERLDRLRATAPVRLVQRTWFNPNLEPLWSAVPALFAVLVAVVGFMVSALSIARERELGTFEQLLVSPLRPFEILIGKSVPALLIALTSASAMLVLGMLFLNVPIRGSLALLFFGMVVYLAAIVGIGLFISSLAKTQQQAIIGLFMYMVPAVLISGYATPVENMPDWLQGLAAATPITHFIVISKAVYLREAPLWLYFSHIWPMALIAAASLLAATWLFRRRTG